MLRLTEQANGRRARGRSITYWGHFSQDLLLDKLLTQSETRVKVSASLSAKGGSAAIDSWAADLALQSVGPASPASFLSATCEAAFGRLVGRMFSSHSCKLGWMDLSL